MPPSSNELITREILRANECLKAAQKLSEIDLWADAISRAYYCSFHAAKALLFTKKIAERSHKGLVSKFGELFVKTGLIEKKYGRILRREKEERELSDYDVTLDFDAEQASTRIRESSDFLKMATEYLKKAEFLEKNL